MGTSVEKLNFKALGADIHVEIVIEDKKAREKARKDLKEVKEVYSAKQKIFCRFNPKSELSKLNRNLGVWQKASPDMIYLAKRALFYNRESEGLYDPRVIEVLESIGYKSKDTGNMNPKPMSGKLKDLPFDLKVKKNEIFLGRRIDFSGIAKGYIIDRAAEFLKKRGWNNFFINVNGDAYAAGRDAKREKWRLPIEGARNKNAAVCISDHGIATSGVIKRRWKHKGKNVHHLVNPQNPGKFSFEIQSVLVLHKKAEWADGRAKVLVLMGLKKGLEHARKEKLKVIFVDKKGKIIFPNQRD
ncbi:MAG: FAD:protein FMN transferase [Patescibacteria group bacterium]|nr:FAD:protein FMN transferase [Patescibacteria group bacterium]